MDAYYDGMTLDEMLHVAVVNISTDVQYRCRDGKIAGFFFYEVSTYKKCGCLTK